MSPDKSKGVREILESCVISSNTLAEGVISAINSGFEHRYFFNHDYSGAAEYAVNKKIHLSG